MYPSPAFFNRIAGIWQMSDEAALLEETRNRVLIGLQTVQRRWARLVGAGAAQFALGVLALGSFAAAGVAGMTLVGVARVVAGGGRSSLACDNGDRAARPFGWGLTLRRLTTPA